MTNDRYFPSNKYEALAFLYVERQDLSNTSPEELAAMYVDAYTRIHSQIINSAWDNQKQN